MLCPNNFGDGMSLDGTCLSNDEVYIILTNMISEKQKY